MGNPSDGFYGKTIALSISNFWADVTIFESAKLVHTYFVKLAHTECWILYSGGLWRGFWFGDLVDLVNITKLKTCQYRYLHAPIALRIQIIKFNTYVESQFAKFNTRQTSLSLPRNWPCIRWMIQLSLAVSLISPESAERRGKFAHAPVINHLN